ncbi:helix-turn-helix domain-containing protein [Exiguobacterium acetylicum]|uniref:winged helix-turn-helix transcriptional regulator n=1 Tax=Exiguobacterium acetylicum TaxID=41170 RepID=UPI0027DFE45B|nr:helix-turn-helix domain-containing protein [Exiguobacterium acetylicum]MDQ6467202.1 helix-turn-helix domain-containing protein [Exiguobacterium acetylicum]
MSRKVLTDQLKELERLKIIEQIEYDEAVLHVEYKLTEASFTLQPVMKGLCAWGEGNQLSES